MEDLGSATTKPTAVQADGEATKVVHINSSPIDSNASPEARPDDLRSVGIIELLETDLRPVFILELARSTTSVPVWHNEHLKDLQILGSEAHGGIEIRNLAGPTKNSGSATFLQWAASSLADGGLPTETYVGIRWMAQTLRKRWRVIAGEVGRVPDILKSKKKPGKPQLDRSQPSVLERPDRTGQCPSPVFLRIHLKHSLKISDFIAKARSQYSLLKYQERRGHSKSESVPQTG